MKTAYFDCFSGASGDMILGALVDVGMPVEALVEALKTLPADGWKIEARTERRQGIAGTRVEVKTEAEPHTHRRLNDILQLIKESGLNARVQKSAARIFERLAEAEAKAHSVSVEQIHFHEVGALDAVIDVVGAAIAVDALGPDSVCGLSMPSRYSSEGSILDARELAENLGIELKTVQIEDVFSSALGTLDPHFEGYEPGLAEENLQSRIRGLLVMAMSNKFGWLVLTTGNKSELAVGYATIYGDMAGGYAVIKDVPKTLVYELCRYRNARGDGPVIPESVLTKPPSAELRADQTDQDSLPPYDALDPILKAYVEEDRSFEEIVEAGFDEQTVKDIIALVDRNEYKRRQAPPGIKITPRNFGRDRRMPIANRYQPF